MHVIKHPRRLIEPAGGIKPGCFWPFEVGYSIANPKWEAHSLSSVVLPKPAGAETSVSLRVTPSFSRSVRRGRETRLALSPACPERSRRVGAGAGNVEFSGQQWHGHFAFPGSAWRPTSLVNQESWMPLFYHILPIPAKLLTCLNAYPQRIGHLGGHWASVQSSKLHWNSSSACYGLLVCTSSSEGFSASAP